MGQYYRILLCDDEGTDKTALCSYDYDGNGVTNLNMVGVWAGDLLRIVEQVPKDDFLDYIDISEDAHFAER